MTDSTASPTRPKPSRIWYVLPVLLIVAAGWSALGRRDLPAFAASDSERNARPGSEAATDPNDPARFRVLQGGVVEDASTGQTRTLSQAEAKADRSTPDRFEELFHTNTDTSSDLRHGVGPRPLRVVSEGIRLDSEVIPIGLDHTGALAVPSRADITGWWSGGAIPGESGPTVIVGHYDSRTAPGVFMHLKDLEAGDVVSVEQSDGMSYAYRITSVEVYAKTDFPTNAVYGDTPGSTLRLVTCGGQFDRTTRHYLDNIVAYAELASTTDPDGITVDVSGRYPFSNTEIRPIPPYPVESTTTTTTIPGLELVDPVVGMLSDPVVVSQNDEPIRTSRRRPARVATTAAPVPVTTSPARRSATTGPARTTPATAAPTAAPTTPPTTPPTTAPSTSGATTPPAPAATPAPAPSPAPAPAPTTAPPAPAPEPEPAAANTSGDSPVA